MSKNEKVEFPVGSTWRDPTNDSLWAYLGEDGRIVLNLPGQRWLYLDRQEER